MPDFPTEIRLKTQEIIAQHEQILLEAVRQQDAQALAPLLHPAVTFILPSGQVITKEDDLAAYRAGLLQVQRLATRDQQIQLLGATATVTVTVELQGRYQGQPLAASLRYLRVWQEIEPGHWQVIAGSGVMLPPATETGDAGE